MSPTPAVSHYGLQGKPYGASTANVTVVTWNEAAVTGTHHQIGAVLDEFEKTAWAGLEPDRYSCHREHGTGVHVHVLSAVWAGAVLARTSHTPRHPGVRNVDALERDWRDPFRGPLGPRVPTEVGVPSRFGGEGDVPGPVPRRCAPFGASTLSPAGQTTATEWVTTHCGPPRAVSMRNPG